MSTPLITQTLLNWHAKHGRHDLPWQNRSDAYGIWLSEIMLQQTQVSTVLPYYEKFVSVYPTVFALAKAPIDEVLHLWTGMGYYARARNLHKAAKMVVAEHGGEFPNTLDAMMALPGVGKSTAGAILAFAYKQHHAILDGNVKRVLARYYAIEGWYGQRKVADALWAKAEANTPTRHIDTYTQAIMDFGATHCTRKNPACDSCPLATNCIAYQTNRTNELPHGKPKKAKPIKHTTMVFVLNQNKELLLIRNPPTGIWGGLWCPPTLTGTHALTPTHPKGTDAVRNKKALKGTDAIRFNLNKGQPVEIAGFSTEISKVLPNFRHTFSHYHLDITPVVAQLQDSVGASLRVNVGAVAEATDQVWYNVANPQALGLAAPIKTLIQQIYSNEPESST